jgi:hypothetical protein
VRRTPMVGVGLLLLLLGGSGCAGFPQRLQWSPQSPNNASATEPAVAGDSSQRRSLAGGTKTEPDSELASGGRSKASAGSTTSAKDVWWESRSEWLARHFPNLTRLWNGQAPASAPSATASGRSDDVIRITARTRPAAAARQTDDEVRPVDASPDDQRMSRPGQETIPDSDRFVPPVVPTPLLVPFEPGVSPESTAAGELEISKVPPLDPAADPPAQMPPVPSAELPAPLLAIPFAATRTPLPDFDGGREPERADQPAVTTTMTTREAAPRESDPAPVTPQPAPAALEPASSGAAPTVAPTAAPTVAPTAAQPDSSVSEPGLPVSELAPAGPELLQPSALRTPSAPDPAAVPASAGLEPVQAPASRPPLAPDPAATPAAAQTEVSAPVPTQQTVSGSGQRFYASPPPMAPRPSGHKFLGLFLIEDRTETLASPQLPAPAFPTTYFRAAVAPGLLLAADQAATATAPPHAAPQAPAPVLSAAATVKKPCVVTTWFQKFRVFGCNGCHHGERAPCCQGCTCYTGKHQHTYKSVAASPQRSLASRSGRPASPASAATNPAAPIGSTGPQPSDVAEEGKLFQRVSFDRFDEAPQR